jgi:hypothetical protein
MAAGKKKWNRRDPSRGRLSRWLRAVVLPRLCSDSLNSSVRAFTSSNHPHILDGDHRLVGEGGDKRNLLFSVVYRRSLADRDDAYRRPAALTAAARS